ncbi:MAG: zinc transporter ZntB [Pseudomonadota bacterium]
MDFTTHGPAGLLHAVVLDGDGGARTLDWHEVRSWRPVDGCQWLHFDLGDESTHHWIAQASDLSEIASSALLSEETRPRTLHRDSRLLVILRGINPRVASDPGDMISLRIWSDGQRLISTRYRGLESTDNVLASLLAGTGAKNAQELIEFWIEDIVDRMKVTVDEFEERVMEIDERVLAGELESVRGELSEVRKQLISLRRYLAPQREALNRLAASAVPWIDEDHRLLLRETTDRLIRHIEDLDEVRDRAVLAHEEMQNQLSEAMNNRAYLFTVVATIFLPLGFLTGLMGINIGGMPGVDNDAAFWIFTAACVGLMLVLALLFRFNRWL